MVRTVLVFALCVFATVNIRDGPLETLGIGERIAIALIWIAGVAYMVWMIAKNSK
jgi:hypothetical protein